MNEWRCGAALRRRTAMELLALVVLTGLYLYLWPQRPWEVDTGLAIFALGLVVVLARDTNERIWGRPDASVPARMRRSTVTMAQFTLPILLAFGLLGAWDAYSVRQEWRDLHGRLFALRVLPTLLLYVPWALLQQTLFQVYLLGRLRVLVPSAPRAVRAGLNGLLYGAVHWPEWDVMAITIAGGLVWSYVYERDRSLLPIAVSHAVLGTAYFAWVRHGHVVRPFGRILG